MHMLKSDMYHRFMRYLTAHPNDHISKISQIAISSHGYAANFYDNKNNLELDPIQLVDLSMTGLGIPRDNSGLDTKIVSMFDTMYSQPQDIHVDIQTDTHVDALYIDTPHAMPDTPRPIHGAPDIPCVVPGTPRMVPDTPCMASGIVNTWTWNTGSAMMNEPGAPGSLVTGPNTCDTQIPTLDTRILRPNIMSPDMLSPDVLSPDMLSPDILRPTILGPDILRPNILSPDVLSPSMLSPSILSPDILNTSILSPDILNTSPLSPDPCVLNINTPSPDTLHPDLHRLNGNILNPETSDPRTSDPGSPGPRTSDPRTSDPMTSGPRTSGPRTSGPRTSGPRTSGLRTSGPRTSGPRTSGPRISDPGTLNQEILIMNTRQNDTLNPCTDDDNNSRTNKHWNESHGNERNSGAQMIYVV
jgi:hypothetical protein